MEYLFGKENRAYIMGIAVLLVILGHLDMFSGIFNGGQILLFDFFKSGGIGVDIFFLASAYGLSFSINKNNTWKFWFNRFKRIYPAYLVFLVLLIYVMHSDWSLKAQLKLFLLQSTGLVFFTSEWYMIEWYVSSMILFYIAFPLIYIILSRIHKFRYVLLVLIGALLIGYVSGKHNIMATQRFAYRIPILVLGIYTYIYRADQQKVLILYTVMAAVGILFYTRDVRDIITMPLICLALNEILRLKSDNKLLIGKQFCLLGGVVIN